MISDHVEHYLESLRPKREGLVKEMEVYAIENNVPIMEQTSLAVMLQLLSFKKPDRILEIGAAIGYSAIRMAELLPDTTIITVERDETRYREAVANIEKAGYSERITIIYGDAFELADELKRFGPYQALFIDAAKGQYKRFFDEFFEVVEEQGIVLSDNILFRGMVAEEEIQEKRFRSMVKKLRHYNEFLMSHPDLNTTIYPVGDGLAVSQRLNS
ncbi:O-methyltransferase [Guptibacillus hwajinpoensis]|uniref:tRNA 5-hydroxyuridine methyltransferase n=1 Tax=Guptibacillus hwajinpoensis TaxID=208199 RepID=A0ABU0JWP1_9BACL|nr:O-methyltransferase [Alkalihalobacillus hemicentroti]MDQ0481500.1 putative O-methyltransferase YrrM [Alkalihalobacillus hemicentroti]